MENERQVDRVFYALSDPTRREILKMIARRGLTISELAAPFTMSLAAVAKHIGVLEEAGLLKKRRDGRSQVCSLLVRPLEQADAAITEIHAFWNHRFDELERFLDAEVGDE